MCQSSKSNSARTRRQARAAAKHIPNVTPIIQTYRELTADELRAGMQTLPIELFDKIVDEFLNDAMPDIRIVQRGTYKPPVQLQINQHLRKEFSKKYYTHSAIWVFNYRRGKAESRKPDGIAVDRKSPDPLYAWWNSLSPVTQAMLVAEKWQDEPLRARARPEYTGGRQPALYLAGEKLAYNKQWVDVEGSNKAYFTIWKFGPWLGDASSRWWNTDPYSRPVDWML